MALNQDLANQWGTYLSKDKKGNPSVQPGSATWISMIQRMKTGIDNNEFTQEDIAPFVKQINGLGYNVDLSKGTYAPIQGGSNGSSGNTGSIYQNPPDTQPKVPTNPNLPTDVPGQTIPGPNINLNSDQGQIEQEAAREKQQTLNAVNQAADLRTQKIGGLGDILLKQNQAQFNYDLPGIKEDLANSGLFSSPSALAAAVTRESGMLGANTQSQLSQAGLSNIDLQAEGLLGANQSAQQMQQGGLQRQFSVADWQKQADLARQIGSTQLPQSPGFSLTGAIGGGSTAGLAGAGLAATNPGLYATLIGGSALAGGSKGGNSYLCTHLNKLGLMTKDEVRKVHKKIFTKSFNHPFSLAAYWIIAPLFIIKADSNYFDWASLKERLCDDILKTKDSEEAFLKYMSVCFDVFFKGLKEVDYGY